MREVEAEVVLAIVGGLVHGINTTEVRTVLVVVPTREIEIGLGLDLVVGLVAVPVDIILLAVDLRADGIREVHLAERIQRKRKRLLILSFGRLPQKLRGKIRNTKRHFGSASATTRNMRS